ncbi:hypothetical protein ACYPKM_00450 [Pseudomonas aeruginosa]
MRQDKISPHSAIGSALVDMGRFDLLDNVHPNQLLVMMFEEWMATGSDRSAEALSGWFRADRPEDESASKDVSEDVARLFDLMSSLLLYVGFSRPLQAAKIFGLMLQRYSKEVKSGSDDPHYLYRQIVDFVPDTLNGADALIPLVKGLTVLIPEPDVGELCMPAVLKIFGHYEKIKRRARREEFDSMCRSVRIRSHAYTKLYDLFVAKARTEDPEQMAQAEAMFKLASQPGMVAYIPGGPESVSLLMEMARYLKPFQDDFWSRADSWPHRDWKKVLNLVTGNLNVTPNMMRGWFSNGCFDYDRPGPDRWVEIAEATETIVWAATRAEPRKGFSEEERIFREAWPYISTSLVFALADGHGLIRPNYEVGMTRCFKALIPHADIVMLASMIKNEDGLNKVAELAIAHDRKTMKYFPARFRTQLMARGFSL